MQEVHLKIEDQQHDLNVLKLHTMDILLAVHFQHFYILLQ